MSNRKKKIDLLRQAIRDAEEALHNAIVREYPVGSLVCVTRGRGNVLCSVVSHCYGTDVKVRNIYNDKEYRVDSYHFEN